MELGLPSQRAIGTHLVLAKIPQDAMMQVFLYGGGMGSNPAVLATFLHGLHLAFLISCGISLVAAAASAGQPVHARQSSDRHAPARVGPETAGDV